MIYSTMLRFDEYTLRRLKDGVAQNTVKILFKTYANKATIGTLSPVYGAVQEFVKYAVNFRSIQNAIGSTHYKFTQFQQGAQTL